MEGRSTRGMGLNALMWFVIGALMLMLFVNQIWAEINHFLSSDLLVQLFTANPIPPLP